jgi:hypothetical protein
LTPARPEGTGIRSVVSLLTVAVIGLWAFVPGASAQTVFTGFEASSTGLISEEGFVNLGTTFECATPSSGASVSAILEQDSAAGTSTAFAFGGRQPEGGLCTPGGSPLALGFPAPSGPPFEPGTATLSMDACVGAECTTLEQTVELRDGGRTIEAPLSPDPRSLFEFGVASKAVLEPTGVVTVGTAVSCGSVSGPAFFGTLEQRQGKTIAEAAADDFLLGGCGADLHPLPVSFIPAADSVAFKARRAQISLTVCAGGTSAEECGTVEARIKIVDAE